MSKKPPLKVSSYGRVERPAVPTMAPSGSVAAVASVAGAGVAETAAAAASVEPAGASVEPAGAAGLCRAGGAVSGGGRHGPGRRGGGDRRRRGGGGAAGAARVAAERDAAEVHPRVGGELVELDQQRRRVGLLGNGLAEHDEAPVVLGEVAARLLAEGGDLLLL